MFTICNATATVVVFASLLLSNVTVVAKITQFAEHEEHNEITI